MYDISVVCLYYKQHLYNFCLYSWIYIYVYIYTYMYCIASIIYALIPSLCYLLQAGGLFDWIARITMHYAGWGTWWCSGRVAEVEGLYTFHLLSHISCWVLGSFLFFLECLLFPIGGRIHWLILVNLVDNNSVGYHLLCVFFNWSFLRHGLTNRPDGKWQKRWNDWNISLKE